MTGLAISAVDVHYGAAPALRGIDLTFSPGGLIGLIGPNGAGKSTLLKVSAGLLTPTRGAIKLDDTPIAAWRPAQRARRIGYLPQTRMVSWPVSVSRLVALGRLPHLSTWQMPDAADDAEIMRALAQTDTAALAERSVTSLSGGELARVLIARLLAGAPEVMLVDEPIAGLDPAHTLQVMSLFKSFAEAGRTVVVVLHDLNVAARYCARLVLLDGGAIVADGSPAAVITPETLARHYQIRATIVPHEGEILVVPRAL